MSFETILCHKFDRRYTKEPIVWRDPHDGVDEKGRAEITPWRTCSYCGSMHPLDFLALYERLKFVPWHVANWNRKGPPTIIGEPSIDMPYCEMADRKYGFPHKVYVTPLEVLHPEREYVTGVGCGTDEDGKPYEKIISRTKGYKPEGKFYTVHFLEEQLDQEMFEKIAKAVGESTGWWFTREPNMQISYEFRNPPQE